MEAILIKVTVDIGHQYKHELRTDTSFSIPYDKLLLLNI